MFEILFKGKSVVDGKPVIGDIIQPNKHDKLRARYGEIHICCEITGNVIRVHPDTVGQFTGFVDKHDIKIFVRDKIKYENEIEFGIGIIEMQSFLNPLVMWLEQSTPIPTAYSGISVLGCKGEIEIIE